MEATHGTWGDRIITFHWDSGLATVLYLRPQQRCSWHCHERCFNQFYVISGKLGVRTDKGYETILTDRQVFTVEPNVFHEFRTYDEGAVIQEIAFVKYDPADIKREKLGGPIKQERDKPRCTDCGYPLFSSPAVGDWYDCSNCKKHYTGVEVAMIKMQRQLGGPVNGNDDKT